MDEESKFILTNRQLYSLTGDYKYMKIIIDNMSEMKILRAISPGNNDYIFGAGVFGQLISEMLPWKLRAFVDNDKLLHGTEIYNLPVIPPEEIPKNARIFIASRFNQFEIIEQLVRLGFQKIFNIGKLLSDMIERQYFEIPEAKRHHENEVFIDAGCFDGWTTKQFIAWNEHKYRKVLAFEPDENNRKIALHNLSELIESGNVELFPFGLWNEKIKLKFSSSGSGSSLHSGEETVDVVALDDQPFAEDITFIKMDIEGAEYKALLGAEQIIRKNKPNLAICLYHKPEDVFEIPQLILKYRSDYRFLLRHYWLREYETVLYAV